jgi:predicted site-specific integrase-resolvase
MWKTVSNLAKMHGVSRQTIGRWIRNNKWEKIKITEGGHYRVWVEIEPIVFLYARISTSKQITSLEKQKELLLKEYSDGKFISDIGSGFNFERRGFRTILEQSLSGSPCIIVATTQDRITRTGFGLIKRIIELSGGEIRLLEEDINKCEKFDTSTLISFITSFINSSYGKRSSKRKRRLNNNEKS